MLQDEQRNASSPQIGHEEQSLPCNISCNHRPAKQAIGVRYFTASQDYPLRAAQQGAATAERHWRHRAALARFARERLLQPGYATR